MITFKEFLFEKITKEYKDIDFEYHDELNPDFWDGDKLRPDIRKQCLKIVEKFLDSFEEFTPKVLDITFTGSLANYNWGSKSDVDIHVIFNSKTDTGNKQIDLEEFLKAKLKNWREDHKDVKIKGLPVEVSIQMSDESHESTGIYSLKKDKWLKQPNEIKDIDLNHDDVVERVEELKKQIKTMLASNVTSIEIEAFKQKIRKARKKGLKKEGEFAIDNLAFKALRKAGLLDKLWQHAKDVSSKELSLN